MAKIINGSFGFFGTTVVTTVLNELTLPDGDCYQTVLESEWEDRVGGVKKTLFFAKNGKKEGDGSVVTDQFDRRKDNWSVLDAVHLCAYFVRYEYYDGKIEQGMKVYRCGEKDSGSLYFHSMKFIFLGWTGSAWPGYTPDTRQLWDVKTRVDSAEFNQQNFDRWCQEIANEHSRD